ncbi:MAG TPA: alternative oxidase, partial [Rubrivivax sp.]|nr:alternative oxidase [Rubrivivax sp.]
NERMHLMTFIEVARPTALERTLFLVSFFLLDLVSRRTAHTLVGYFEEEAVLSYTQYLAEIDSGRVPNFAAPTMARRYWRPADDATRRHVVLVVHADEAHHRDVSHGPVDPAPGAPYPAHADSTR